MNVLHDNVLQMKIKYEHITQYGVTLIIIFYLALSSSHVSMWIIMESLSILLLSTYIQ